MELHPSSRDPKKTRMMVESSREAWLIYDYLGPINRRNFFEVAEVADESKEWPFEFEISNSGLRALATRLGRPNHLVETQTFMAGQIEARIEEYFHDAAQQ